MKKVSTVLTAVVALVLATVLSFGLAAQPPAEASGHTCTVTALGASPNLSVSCTGPDGEPVSPSDIDVQGIVGNVVTVVVENEVVKTVTDTITKNIQVPGPTKTVTVRPPQTTETVRPPQTTETVRLPGERETIYRESQPTRIFVPGPQTTKTVTLPPEPAETETVTAQPAPPIRQVTPPDGRMDSDEGRGFFRPDFDLDDGEVTATEAGTGFLTLILLVGLLLVAMYAGYILGYKDRERKDTDFMRALLEAATPRRGNHS